MKKISGILSAGCLLLAAIFTGCKYEGDNITIIQASSEGEKLEMPFTIEKFNQKKVKLYLLSDTTPYSYDGEDLEISVYLPVSNDKEISDVPYLTVTEAINVFDDTNSIKKVDGDKISYKREDVPNYAVIFDESEKTVRFQDYDEFVRRRYSVNILDLSSSANKAYISGNATMKTEIHGKSILINMEDYGIPFKVVDDEVYVPLQFVNDVLTDSFKFVYNKNGFYNSSVVNSAFYDEDSGKNDRSDELVKYNYNELCLEGDLFYGLKDTHGITTFNEYLTNSGLVRTLKGYNDANGNFVAASAESTTKGMKELLINYFGDYHSWFSQPSYYAGKDCDPDITVSPTYSNQKTLMSSYRTLRSNSLGRDLHEAAEGHRVADYATVFDYCEYSSTGTDVMDTAVLTYDNFVTAGQSGTDYFALTENGTDELSYDDVNDTVGLVIYAQQQIAKNQNIKNVVIDLTCNNGGAIDSLMYICSWFIDNCTFSLKNTLTGALGTTVYTADVNLDGTFGGDGDSLSSLTDSEGNARKFNLYCITSIMSFSCGNTLPALLKESGKVTLLGKTSGGGTCVVCNGSTADSSVFNMSSCYQFSTVKNGSFYQIDQGIVPDFSINNFENTVYDRENLALYLANLQ